MAAGSRGRVVMLVHNGVRGDSRVQKTARSAAAAGWEVILLGRALDRVPSTFAEGDAEVRLLKVSFPLNRRRHEFRRRWLRAPLAYPPTGIAAHHTQSVKAWQADLTVRRALLGASQPSTGRKIRSAALRAESRLATAYGRWVAFRTAELARGAEARRRMTGPWDRAVASMWQRLMGDRAWRRLEPRLWDYEIAYGPVIDKLRPDIIHAHDFWMLGVGARAAIRGRTKKHPVKLVWDAHEYLPGVSPGNNTVRWLPGHMAAEKEYSQYADAVVTVSETLGEMLVERHHLKIKPVIVLNAPDDAGDLDPDVVREPVVDIRTRCGVDAESPLLVYSGGAVEHRGLGIMVEALPSLPGAHVAFVVPNVTDPYVTGLQARATELGVANRVHVLGYVPYWAVPQFLATADIGVIPIHHWPNHEIALITKFFEYSHARLPIAVSDVKTMAEMVRDTGQGEVFRAEDLQDYLTAVRAVLDDPKRYRAAYDVPGRLEGWTWRAQAKVLDDLYERLAGERPTSA